MKLTTLFLVTAVLLLGACRTEQAAPEAADTAAATSAYDVFGEAFSDEGALPVQAVAAEPDAYVGQPVKIEGTVAEVCQQAGCWLTLQVPDGNNVRIVVPRDDEGNYVFTVAKDISGRRAVVQGTLSQEMLSEHLQHHLAEDAASEHMDEDGEHDEHMAEGADHEEHMAEETDAAPMEHEMTEGGTAMPELQVTATGVLVEKA